MYVSALLKQQGVQVKVLNCNLHEYDLDKELIGATDVFFTGFDPFINEIKRVASICRNKNIHTVVGGAVATYSKELLEPYVDTIYHGEFFPHLAIDDNPWPDYKGFGIDEYHKRHTHRYMGVITSRGCPYSCAFCSSVCKFRVRSLTSVQEEIKHYIDKYKIELLVVNDNTLNFTEGRFSDFNDMIRPLNIKWSAALRLDNINDDLIKSAKDAGLVHAIVGVESFDQKKLDIFNKQITVEKIKTGLDILESNHLKYYGNLLISNIKELLDYRPVLEKYHLFPVEIKKFAGNNVVASSKNIANICREYVVSNKMLYYE